MITEQVYTMLLQRLHVTYTPDPDTAARIRNEGSAGLQLIQKYCDPTTDCSPGTRCGELLCEYVMRAEAGAAETFLRDFAQDILELQTECQVNNFAEVMAYAETDG